MRPNDKVKKLLKTPMWRNFILRFDTCNSLLKCRKGYTSRPFFLENWFYDNSVQTIYISVKHIYDFVFGLLNYKSQKFIFKKSIEDISLIKDGENRKSFTLKIFLLPHPSVPCRIVE